MIRILSYKEHPRGKEIFDRYLYLAAYVLPFSAEDVIGEDALEVDGRRITAGNFIEESGKQPRKRTKKYLKLLENAGLAEDTALPTEERLQQDYRLAAKLIKNASEKLYCFLYQNVEADEAEEADIPVINRINLRNLLTVKMDEMDGELKEIGKVKREDAELLLNEVFRYDAFSNHPYAVKMLEAMDVNVCPYCNRLYTVTLTEAEHKSRPQFDHYKSKSGYPYLAISLMNLIPCCGLCNLSKHDREEEVLYPYSDEMGTDAMFRTESETGLTYLTGNRNAADEFRVVLEMSNPNLESTMLEKIKNSDEAFNLTELYNKHKDYILYLFRKNYIFSEEYLKTLCEEFPEMFESFEDAKNMMYLMDIDKKQWGRRSLGKLTHDIDWEIREMTRRKK